jgi:hypothetical protein
MKPIDELSRTVDAKIGALWTYASNSIGSLSTILEPGYFNSRFPDRQMRTGDEVKVYLFDGDTLKGVADLVVCEVRGKVVAVAKREDILL